MQLTKHFTLDEFIESPTARRLGITEQFTPPQKIIDNIKKLADILEKARVLAKTPFDITSGYRCPKLNKAVGGVANSAHLTGLAVDIAFGSDRTRAKKILDALIAAGFKRIGLGWNFIHVDIDTTKSWPACWLYGSKTPAWLAAWEADIERRIKQ